MLQYETANTAKFKNIFIKQIIFIQGKTKLQKTVNIIYCLNKCFLYKHENTDLSFWRKSYEI